MDDTHEYRYVDFFLTDYNIRNNCYFSIFEP